MTGKKYIKDDYIMNLSKSKKENEILKYVFKEVLYQVTGDLVPFGQGNDYEEYIENKAEFFMRFLKRQYEYGGYKIVDESDEMK